MAVFAAVIIPTVCRVVEGAEQRGVAIRSLASALRFANGFLISGPAIAAFAFALPAVRGTGEGGDQLFASSAPFAATANCFIGGGRGRISAADLAAVVFAAA
jgi:hypothetical protein